MDQTYWEKIAPDYEAEIFDVLHHDKKAAIKTAIAQLAAPFKSVLDAGCAVGKWLPVLSPQFKKVYALDISSRNLTIAKNKYPTLTNVTYQQANLSRSAKSLPHCHVAVCINAILTSSMNDRMQFFRSLSRSVKRGGHLVLVVPSLESYLLTTIASTNWKISKGASSSTHPRRSAAQKWKDMLQGNAAIDNVPTKHYLKEELQILLKRFGFVAESFQKIEYVWNTEFPKVPSWLKDPYPWDWLCVATKKV